MSTDIAALSAVLAKSYTNLPSDNALLAGLTHSIGVSPILVKAESDPALLNNPEKLHTIIIDLYPAVGEAILKNWGFSSDMVNVPGQHLNITRVHDGDADYTDIVQVALIQTVSGTDHPLGEVNISDVPAFHIIGMEDMEEIDMSGGVEELKAAIA